MNTFHDIRSRICRMIHAISPRVKQEDISDEMNLIQVGVLDSLGFLTLATQVQHEFAIEIPFDRYAPEDFTTFGRFVEICSDAIQEHTAGDEQASPL